MDDLTDLIELLNEARAHCGMCGEQAVVRNSRGQYICEACLHETTPTLHYRMRWEAADAIEALQSRVAELGVGHTDKADAWDAVIAAGKKARRDAFEEAAKVAYECGSEPISEAIRALAEKG